MSFPKSEKSCGLILSAKKVGSSAKVMKKSVKKRIAPHAKSSFKLGAGFIGIVAAGALLIFSQLLTLGFLTLAVGGGALGGYLMRTRQELMSRSKDTLAISDERKPVIDISPAKG